MMSLAQLQAAIVVTTRLTRNSNRRISTLRDKIWTRPNRCKTCAGLIGEVKRDEAVFKVYRKESAYNCHLWNRHWTLMEHVSARKKLMQKIPPLPKQPTRRTK